MATIHRTGRGSPAVPALAARRSGSLSSTRRIVPFLALIAAFFVCTGAAGESPRGEGRPSIFLPPIYMQGLSYEVAPPLLSGRWQHADGARSTWITPLYHKTMEADGSLRHMHMLNYFAGRDYRVVFPLAYSVSEHAGVPPFYFRGPLFKQPASNGPALQSAPLERAVLRSARSTWLTPLYHKTTEADGTLRHMHALNYVAGPNRATFFPFVWRKRQGTATSTVVPGILSTHRPDKGKPTRFRLLGGLIAKDCDYERGKHRFRFLWIIPIGSWKESKAGR